MGTVLNNKVLLLNASYEPLMLVSGRKAIILLVCGKVDSLDDYPFKVRSTYMALNLPSVIRLKEYINYRFANIALSRKNILIRDNYTCQYCGKKLSPNKLTIDHIIPKYKGGRNSWKNLVAACKVCNSKKGNFVLKNINMELIKKPIKPNFIFHFQKEISKHQNSWKQYLFLNEK